MFPSPVAYSDKDRMMVVNTTKAPITVGRFRILPGEKLPAVTLTDQEQADVARLLGRGLFRKVGAPAVEQPKSVPVPQEAAPKEAEPSPQTVDAEEHPEDDSEEKTSRRSRNKR